MANYREEARRAARRHGINPDIFERQINQESGFNPAARSPAGAQGHCSVYACYCKRYGS
jgi:soluble lytic murein transglycosylase-like protein